MKLNTIERWYGVVRLTLKLILLDSKLRKESLALTHSSVLIAKINIKLIATIVYSGSTDLTESSMQRNLKSSKKSEPTQFAQPWVGINNN